jgi:cell fate (sporulation/competence/biofilm development) regulator YlbF (YheA/YmcA/DUF963 family)
MAPAEMPRMRRGGEPHLHRWRDVAAMALQVQLHDLVRTLLDERQELQHV